MDLILLRWPNYPDHLYTSLVNLRVDQAFSDVSLAVEGENESDVAAERAHRFVLANASPYFRDVLALSRDPGEAVVVRRVTRRQLGQVLDFVYSGEVVVAEADLDAFMAAVKELQIRGLDGRDGVGPEVRRMPATLPPLLKRQKENGRSRSNPEMQAPEEPEGATVKLTPGAPGKLTLMVRGVPSKMIPTDPRAAPTGPVAPTKTTSAGQVAPMNVTSQAPDPADPNSQEEDVKTPDRPDTSVEWGSPGRRRKRIKIDPGAPAEVTPMNLLAPARRSLRNRRVPFRILSPPGRYGSDEVKDEAVTFKFSEKESWRPRRLLTPGRDESAGVQDDVVLNYGANKCGATKDNLSKVESESQQKYAALLNTLKNMVKTKLTRLNYSRRQCRICGKKFSSSSHSREHLENAHVEPTLTFKCPVCPKIFSHRSALGNHVRIAHRLSFHLKDCAQFVVEEESSTE